MTNRCTNPIPQDGHSVCGHCANDVYSLGATRLHTLNGSSECPAVERKQVPEQTISDECKYCAEGEPEWSNHAQCWIHRRTTLDKRCTRKRMGPIA